MSLITITLDIPDRFRAATDIIKEKITQISISADVGRGVKDSVFTFPKKNGDTDKEYLKRILQLTLRAYIEIAEKIIKKRAYDAASEAIVEEPVIVPDDIIG